MNKHNHAAEAHSAVAEVGKSFSFVEGFAARTGAGSESGHMPSLDQI